MNTQFFIKFKAYFDGDVRRFSFENRPSYTEFTDKLKDIYSLPLNDTFHITYKDDTNDNISITNILDFDESLNFYKDSGFDILKLYITYNKVNQNNNSNNNSNNTKNEKKNVGELESLFVSLLSNQMIQQMIPQVISGLASNPSIMTSIIQTAGNSLRNQSIQQNSHLNDKSPNTFHTQSTDSIVLSLPKLNNISNNTTTTTTTTTNVNNTTLKKSSDEAYSTMITSSSSSSSLLDIAKSFEEIESSPPSTSVIVTNTGNSPSLSVSGGIPNRSPSPDKEKKNPNILSQVPKIFQNIHLPFTSSKPDSPSNSVVQFKKEEANTNITVVGDPNPINTTSTSVPIHEYVPQQIYPIQSMPYSSPNFSYHLPSNTNIAQPYQPPQPYTNTNTPSILLKPTAPVIPQPTISLQPQPQQPQPQPQPTQQPQPQQAQQPQQLASSDQANKDKVKFIQEALGVSSVRANELFIHHKGNVEEIFEQNQN